MENCNFNEKRFKELEERVKELEKRLSNLEGEKKQEEINLDKKISEVLYSLGFKSYLKGFEFTSLAIKIIIQEENSKFSKLEEVYRKVGTEYSVPITVVERNIRTAKDMAFSNNMSKWLNYGFTERPINKEAIVEIARRIKLEL